MKLAKNMNRSLACVRAVYRQRHIYVSYADGNEIHFLISANRRLCGQPEEKLNHIEIGHLGLSWPDLDEDLSHAGLPLVPKLHLGTHLSAQFHCPRSSRCAIGQ
jgi:hypothetical protein